MTRKKYRKMLTMIISKAWGWADFFPTSIFFCILNLSYDYYINFSNYKCILIFN